MINNTIANNIRIKYVIFFFLIIIWYITVIAHIPLNPNALSFKYKELFLIVPIIISIEPMQHNIPIIKQYIRLKILTNLFLNCFLDFLGLIIIICKPQKILNRLIRYIVNSSWYSQINLAYAVDTE